MISTEKLENKKLILEQEILKYKRLNEIMNQKKYHLDQVVINTIGSVTLATVGGLFTVFFIEFPIEWITLSYPFIGIPTAITTTIYCKTKQRKMIRNLMKNHPDMEEILTWNEATILQEQKKLLQQFQEIGQMINQIKKPKKSCNLKYPIHTLKKRERLLEYKNILSEINQTSVNLYQHEIQKIKRKK